MKLFGVRRNFRARLNYDPVEAEVFLEILDPETGEVFRRLPAEGVPDDDTSIGSGALLNRIA